jgi:hypothetical protein
VTVSISLLFFFFILYIYLIKNIKIFIFVQLLLFFHAFHDQHRLDALRASSLNFRHSQLVSGFGMCKADTPRMGQPPRRRHWTKINPSHEGGGGNCAGLEAVCS